VDGHFKWKFYTIFRPRTRAGSIPVGGPIVAFFATAHG
jgi:hypothetical protein